MRKHRAHMAEPVKVFLRRLLLGEVISTLTCILVLVAIYAKLVGVW